MRQAGHVKIAITTNGLTKVDANFNSTKQIVFYDIGYDSAEFLDCVQFKGGVRGGKGPGGGQGGAGCWMSEIEAEEADGVDPLAARIDSLDGCGILFTKGLSDPAAVRVHARKVFPVKMEMTRDIDEVITQLQRMMNNNPPLWLRKAIGIHIWNGEFQVEVANEADEVQADAA